MGLIFGLFLIIGILLNTIFIGFNALNIIYLILSAAFLIYSLPFTKKVLKFGVNVKRDRTFNFIFYTVLLIIFFSSGKLLSSKDPMQYSYDINKCAELIQDGDVKKAEKQLVKLYEKNPSNPLVNENLAVVYLKDKRTDLVKVHLDNASKELNFDENLWYNYGMLYYQQKDYKKAQECFEIAIKLNPNMVKAHIYAGTMSYRLRDLRRAIYHLENAKTISPNSPEILFHLGRANMDLMQYKDAEECLSLALSNKPSKPLETSIQELLKEVKGYRGGNK